MPDYVIKGSAAPYPRVYAPITKPQATRTFGLSQPDLLLKSALDAGFADLRKYPFLLDYCFAWLPQDPITYNKNGKISVKAAKDWFLNTEINVVLSYHPFDITPFPCIAISIVSSTEDSNTTGDTNYDTDEQMQSTNLIAILNSTANAYDSTTGYLTVANPDSKILTNTMLVYDLDDRTTSPILSVNAINQVVLDTGITTSFKNIAILPATQFYNVALESARFKETYNIDMYTNTKQEDIIYMSCLTQFCLLRYRQAYLDERGFEQTSIASNAVNRVGEMDKEAVFTRSMSISGYVQQYWPKEINLVIQGLQVSLVIASNLDGPVGDTPTQLAQEPWTTEKTDFATNEAPFQLLDSPFEE